MTSIQSTVEPMSQTPEREWLDHEYGRNSILDEHDALGWADRFLRDFPCEMGRTFLYNRRTHQYCIVGWALSCAGLPDDTLADNLGGAYLNSVGRPMPAADLAAALCGYTWEFWHSLADNNDVGGHPSEHAHDRATRMRAAYLQAAVRYPGKARVAHDRDIYERPERAENARVLYDP